MNEAWAPGRAWIVALLAAVLLLLGRPSGPAGIEPLPDCALHVELRGDVAAPGAVCFGPEGVPAGGLPGAEDCLPPSGYAPRDGDRLTVSREAGGCTLEPGRMAGAALLTLGLPIDLNRAGSEDLIALPGIGPVLARRIVERSRAGPFTSVDQLEQIRGIGPKKLAALRRLVIASGTVDTPAPRM